MRTHNSFSLFSQHSSKLIQLVILFSCLPSFAQSVSIDEARRTAFNVLRSHASAHHAAPATASQLELAYTASSRGRDAYYVFTGQAPLHQGFVIVSADERVRPVLGYSMQGQFLPDSLPSNVRWWLSLLQRQVDATLDDGSVSASSPISRLGGQRRAAQRRSIPMMLTTQWDQNHPYNSNIPALPSMIGNYALAAGCTPVATAQIMKYFRHPLQGKGSRSYPIYYNDTPITYSADFAGTTYQWDLMLNHYSGSYSEEERDAMAQLIYHVGIAENTTYGQIITGGSSTDNLEPGRALTTYFDYDKSLMYRMQDYYNDSDWQQLIYDELAAGRPMLFFGQTTSSGHAFVCHGYDADKDLYAINWGWGGYCDGYFALCGSDALFPYGSGIGGGNPNESYSHEVSVLMGIKPNEGGQYRTNLVCFSDYTMSTDGYGNYLEAELDRSTDSEMQVSLQVSIYNIGIEAASTQLGVIMRNVSDGPSYQEVSTHLTSLRPSYYTMSYPLRFSTGTIVEDGVYEILPAFLDEAGQWTVMPYPAGQNVPRIVVKGGIHSGERQPVSFSLENDVIEVRQTTRITHDTFYHGPVTYRSEDTSVATVSEDGVVLGLSPGTTTLYAHADGDSYYEETEQSFSIQVEPIVQQPLLASIELSPNNVAQGKVYEIRTPSDFDGQVDCHFEPDDIVQLNENGQIIPLRDGLVTAYVNTSETEVYHATRHALTFRATAEPERTGGLDIVETPVMGLDGVAWDDNLKLHLSLENPYEPFTELKMVYQLEVDDYVFRGINFKHYFTPAYADDFELDLTSYAAYMKYDTPYTVYLFHDEACSQPFNVPSVTFVKSATGTIAHQQPHYQFSTLCLSFDANVPVQLRAFEVTRICQDQLVLTEVNRLTHGRPVLLFGPEDSYEFEGPVPTSPSYATYGFLTGLLNTTEVPAGASVVEPGSELQLRQLYEPIQQPLHTAFVNTGGLDLGAAPTSLSSLSAPLQGLQSIYSPDGKCLSSPQRGLNIFRMADGTTRKVIIK